MALQWKTCPHCHSEDMPFKSGVLICLNEGCPSNQGQDLYGKKVCITGTFKYGDQRAIKKLLTDAGAEIKSSVSRQVDMVIRGARFDSNVYGHSYDTDKERAAKRLGIPIVDEAEFLSLIGHTQQETIVYTF